MQRELTFYPEIERTRDLLYSEYTSCDRSIHVLLQDNSLPQYRFLLEAYREIVSRYLSTSRIQSPISFIKDIADRLEELSRATGFTVDDFKSMGFHMLLRSEDGYFLLASRDDETFVCSGSEFFTLSDLVGSGVERLHFDGSLLQEELFPQRLRDSFLLFRLDPVEFRDRDIVLGCGEEDKSTVLEALSDPLWLTASDQRNTLASKFITRRVLVLRFDDVWTAGVQPHAPRVTRRAIQPRRLVLVGGVVGAGILVFFATKLMFPSDPGRSASQALLVSETVPKEEVVEPQVDEVAEDEEYITQLTENWQKGFKNPVTSSPVLHGNAVIFGCRDKNVYALDRQSGETLWTAKASGGVGASPVVTNGLVLTADYTGRVVALDVGTGERKWLKKLPGKVVSSPAVLDGKVVVGCFDGVAYCLSMADGSVLWKRQTASSIWSSVAAGGGTFYVASQDGFLYALSSVTGDVKWRYEIKGAIASSPFLHRDLIVIGAPQGGVHAVNTADGKRRWRYDTGGPVKSSPVVVGGLVYVGSNDHWFYCLDVADGSEVWKYQTGGYVLSRPDILNGVAYVGSYDGFMHCLDAKTGELLDKFQSGGEIYSSPAVDERAVYFGNNQGKFVSLNHRVKKTL